jgi:acyl dehydratase
MSKESIVEGLKHRVGQPPHVGEWLTIDRQLIDTFTELSQEDSFIHVDSERTRRETQYEDIIAQGNLALSLCNRLTKSAGLLDELDEQANVGLNYGWNKVRFPAPLPVNARINGSVVLKQVSEVANNGVEVVREIVIHIEGQEKPCFVGEAVSRYYF